MELIDSVIRSLKGIWRLKAACSTSLGIDAADNSLEDLEGRFTNLIPSSQPR
ncbi:hypothetical protein KK141_06820 [Dyella sp. LX-66]|uniref:hypothetical protein n=1 Tax=unclassified Dyella TaxID=2634549 RepID=UPI001BDF9111|nr:MULTISPECIES: hypothetical protein [unclassified Dyella]MBT2115423.1 hypothetical protein [Dyella sp. LX-1]MBT2139238.1 hypothetical protein [Dyella sp. LX-66]